MLQYIMEVKRLKQKDLVPYFGSASRVSEFLGGKSKLTLEQVSRLHKGLGIPAETLLPQVETIVG
jgi:HTH-type transcriptional regulator / antitoxin HigA